MAPAADVSQALGPRPRALEIETLLAEPDTRATLQLPFEEAGVVLDMVVAHFMATGTIRSPRAPVARPRRR